MSLDYTIRPKRFTEDSLKGNVKKVIESKSRNNNIVREKAFYVKNNKRLIIYEKVKNSSGELYLIKSNKYNESTLCIEKESFQEKDRLIEKTELVYSDAGRLQKEIKTLRFGIIHKYIYEYESDERYTVKIYDKDDDIIQVIKYGPNNKKIIDQIQYFGNINEYWQYRYNNNGDLILYSWYKRDDTTQNLSIFHQRVYEYNEDNDLTAEIWLDASNNMVDKTIYQYNEDVSALTELRFDINSNLKHRKEYKFDHNNNLVGYTFDDNYGNPFHSVIKYIFDEIGNWILKKEIANEKTINVTERSIEYKKTENIFFIRGEANFAKGDKKTAISDLTAAIKTNPNLSEAYFIRGEAYSDLGEFQLAILDFNSAITLKPDYINAYAMRGIVYAKQGKYRLVINDMNHAIKHSPPMGALHSQRGVAYGMIANYELAHTDFNTAISIDPAFAESFSNRGVNYSKQGKYELAISDYSSAIKIEPGNEEFYYNRANAYSKLDKFDLAIMDYNKAIEIDSQYANALNNRGDVFFRYGKYEKAIDDFNSAISINPNLSEAYFTRGEVYYKQGKNKLCISDFKKAANLGDPDAIDNLRTFFGITY